MGVCLLLRYLYSIPSGTPYGGASELAILPFLEHLNR